MSNINIIQAGNSSFMGEFLDDLPKNCILNKVLTGAGGTTVALTNPKPYIIAVPFKNLITNKLQWGIDNDINILGVMEGVNDATILEYISNNKVPKIMVTYDSLEKVTELINPKDYNLLIDESHKLVDSGDFRGKAVRGVLNSFEKYNQYCFMTATPVKDKYQLPALTHLPKYIIQWSNISPVTVDYSVVNKHLIEISTAIITDHLEGRVDGTPHIFINSVDMIGKILRILFKKKFTEPKEVNVICSDTSENRKTLKDLAKRKVDIKKAGEVNKVNFYTATAFEGCDIYDTEGISYLITDGKLNHTKVDLLTTLPQIIGRVRDAKQRNRIRVIFSKSHFFSYTTEEGYESHVKGKLKEAEEVVDNFNQSNSKSVRETLLIGVRSNPFIVVENGEMYINDSAWYAQMHSFATINTTYHIKENGVIPNKTINGVDYTYNNKVIENDLNTLTKLKIDKPANFKELCETYFTLIKKEKKSKEEVEFLTTLHLRQPIITKGYKILGEEKMRALKLVKKMIKDEMVVRDKIKSMAQKVIKMYPLRTGQFVSAKEVKVKLQSIYDKLNIYKLAKSTELKEYYEVKEKSKRVEGKVVAGYVIVLPKIKVLQSQ